MKRAEVLVLERDLEAVTTELGRLGLVHLEHARLPEVALESPPERTVDTEAEHERLQNLAARVDALAEMLGVERQEPPGETRPADADRLEQDLAALEQEARKLVAKRDAAAAEEERLVNLAGRLEPLEEAGLPVSRVEQLDFLHFAVGTLPVDQERRLRREVRDDVVLVPLGPVGGEQRRLLAVSSRKGRWALKSALEASGFQAAEPPEETRLAPGEAARAVRERLHDVRARKARLESVIDDLRRRAAPSLNRYARGIALRRRMLTAQRFFGRTGSAALISGWVPSTKVDLLRRHIERALEGRVVIEFRDPEELGTLEAEPPVLLEHNRFLRPFEVLVSGYGTPTYTEVEPTAFVAVTYLVMYGLMFGDLGQGLVLALVGFVLRRRASRRGLRDLGGVMMYAGGSGALFGLVYNSVFSKDGLLPWRALVQPLGQGPGVKILLGFALVFGILMISLAMVLNVINRFSRRDFLGGMLDRFGLAGMVIYWGAIGLGMKALVFGGTVRAWEVGLFIGLPIVVLFFKEPIYAVLTHRHKLYQEGLFTGLMEAGIEVLETFSDFLANTLSFLRVGAFALAHAGLSLGIFETERIIRGGGGLGRTLASAAAVVAGNLLIIGLEGLVVGIQAARLEYYEFMSRFFRGTGRRFRPFRLAGSADGGG